MKLMYDMTVEVMTDCTTGADVTDSAALVDAGSTDVGAKGATVVAGETGTVTGLAVAGRTLEEPGAAIVLDVANVVAGETTAEDCGLAGALGTELGTEGD